MVTNRPVKRAFLVGISDYGDPNPNGSNLPGCKNDVEALAAVLHRKGFECAKWIDQPLQTLLPNGELKSHFSGANNPADTILFYFSGHGVDVAGEQILIGPGAGIGDFNSDVTTGRLLVLSSVLDELAQYAAQKVVIIDACRVTKRVDAFTESLQRSRRAAIQSLSNCVVVYASADGTKSYMTPNNDGSRFTRSLAGELRKYGRGILATVEATMEQVDAYRDGKSQTPWIYASLRDRPLDGYRIEDEALDRACFPKYVGATVGGVAWAVVSGSNALAQFVGRQFICKARLPASVSGVGMRSFHPHPNGSEHALVKAFSKCVHLLKVSHVSASWHTKPVSVKRLNPPGMTRVFGAWWSPAGTFLAAFGAPKSGLIGVSLWSTASSKSKRESIDGLPSDLEINSAVWINEGELLVAGSQSASSSSNVFLLERIGNEWRASLMWRSSSPLRITSMLVAENKNDVYLGADDGSVATGILSQPNQPVFLPREHATTGRTSLALMPWTGSSRRQDLVETGVCSMAFDELTRLLAVTYFDGTVALLDPILGSCVKAITLSSGARRPTIVSIAPGSFLCADGEGGRLVKVVPT